MKAAIVSASLTRKAGGILDSLLGLTRELVLLPDTQVRALGFQEQDSDEDLKRWGIVPVHTFPVSGPRGFGFSPELKRNLLTEDYTLAHTHGIWMYPSAAIVAWHKQTRRPYVVSPHGMLDEWALANNRWKKKLAARLFEDAHLRDAACLHALCASEAAAMRRYGLRRPIAVIPNGIDLPSATALASESGNPPWARWVNPGQKILLFLSRIHPKKGLVNLLKAWAQIRKSEIGSRQSEEWVLAIAGWDQQGHESELKGLGTELGLSWADTREALTPRVGTKLLFVGPQFEAGKAASYAGCTAYILPSFSEGLPMAVLEAWAYSRPVLMTPECNLPEGFAAGAALPIETEVEGLRVGLGALLESSSSELVEIGRRGRKLVEDRFVWPKIAVQMSGVYLWVVGSGPKPDFVQT